MSELEPGFDPDRRRFLGLMAAVVGGVATETLMAACGVDPRESEEVMPESDWIDALPEELKTDSDESRRAREISQNIQETLATTAILLGKLGLRFYDAQHDAIGHPIEKGEEGPPGAWSGLTIIGRDTEGNKLSATFALGSDGDGIVRDYPKHIRLDLPPTTDERYISITANLIHNNKTGEDTIRWQYDGFDPQDVGPDGKPLLVTTNTTITTVDQLAQLDAIITTQLNRLIPPADLSVS